MSEIQLAPKTPKSPAKTARAHKPRGLLAFETNYCKYWQYSDTPQNSNHAKQKGRLIKQLGFATLSETLSRKSIP